MGTSERVPDLDQLLEAFIDRLRRGEEVDAEVYAEQYPALADEIRDLFPVLAVMQALKPSSPDDTPDPTGPGPASPDAAGPSLGQIGPYRVERELGRGGMGRVFECRGVRDEHVAVKVIHPHLLDRPGYLARFFREVEAGRRIQHAGVVRTLDSGMAAQADAAEVPYLVLEFVEGQNLRELLAEISPLSERLCRVIGHRVADGLAAVHAAGMVHRDVKPENVVVTNDETVKLMDLGVALIRDERFRLSATGEFVGSLLYAAPEQLRVGHVGPKADLFGLGLVLFELMTGHHPSTEGGSRPLPLLRTDDLRISLLDHAPHASPFLDALVRSLLDPDPKRRPASAAEVATTLAEGEASAWWQAQVEADLGLARRRGRVAPCHGREAELRALDLTLERVRRGLGSVTVVEGEQGIGKSHLLETWLDALADQPDAPRIMRIEHAEEIGATPASKVASALVEQLGETDLARQVRDALGGTEAYVEAVVAQLQGQPVEEPLSPVACEAAYLRLMLRLADPGGLVVVVEDLGRESDAWIQSFLRLGHGVADGPVLLLAGVRAPAPQVLVDGLRQLPRAETLALGPLDREASFKLVRGVIEGVRSSASGVRELVRRAGGNPYFLVELARELARRTDEDTHPDPVDAADLALPESLDALVEARLATLPRIELELLSAAACAGDLIEPDVVLAAAGVPKLAGLRRLHALDREHRLLEPVGDRYRFRQRLAQEKLHGGLPPTLRAAYHAEIGRVMASRLAPGETPPHLAYAVARQFLQGDAPERAVPFAVDALGHVLRQYEFQRASDMASRLLEIGPALPPDVHAQVAFVKGTSLVAHAAPKDALPFFERALAMAEEADDTHLALRVLVQLVDCEREGGEIESALSRVDKALDRVEALGDTRLAAELYGQHARLLRDVGRLDDARAVARKGLETAAESRDSLAAGVLSFFSGSFELEAGNIDGGRVLLDRAVSIAHMQGERSLESGAMSSLANLAYIQCRLGEAVDLLHGVLELARELGQTRIETVTALNLAQIVPHTGQYATAAAYGERALEVSRSLGYAEIHARSILALGTTRALEGRLGDALDLLEEATTRLEEIPTPVIRVRHAVVLSGVQASLGRFHAARAGIRLGIAEAERTDAPGELAAALWAKGLLLDEEGRRAEALETLLGLDERVRAAGTLHSNAVRDQRVAELHVLEGNVEPARVLLAQSEDLAGSGGLRGLAALCRVWRELLPDGNPLHARIELDRHGAFMPAASRLRVLDALAGRSGDAAFAKQAHAEAEALIASAPVSDRAAMHAAPRYRSVARGSSSHDSN